MIPSSLSPIPTRFHLKYSHSLNWWGSFKPGVKTHRLEADLCTLLATGVDACPLHQVILSDYTSVWHMAGTEQSNTEMTLGKVFNLEY